MGGGGKQPKRKSNPKYFELIFYVSILEQRISSVFDGRHQKRQQNVLYCHSDKMDTPCIRNTGYNPVICPNGLQRKMFLFCRFWTSR